MKVEVMLTKPDNIDILAKAVGRSKAQLKLDFKASVERVEHLFFEVEMDEAAYKNCYTLRGVYLTPLSND